MPDSEFDYPLLRGARRTWGAGHSFSPFLSLSLSTLSLSLSLPLSSSLSLFLSVTDNKDCVLSRCILSEYSLGVLSRSTLSEYSLGVLSRSMYSLSEGLRRLHHLRRDCTLALSLNFTDRMKFAYVLHQ